jgi:multidrug resistance protein, MATE family
MSDRNPKIREATSGGMMEVLVIALPLALSSACNAVNLFIDRMMLTWYSPQAMAAGFPAGITAFAIASVFVGIIGYTSSFVAQYVGAKMDHRVGVAVWQGIILAFIGGAACALTWFIAPDLFRAFGHARELQPLETDYYRVLALGTICMLLQIALGCFWSGRGKTVMVMTVTVIVVLCNIPLNYLLIFGHTLYIPFYGTVTIPEFGIRGAALGTRIAELIGVLIYLAAFFGVPEFRRRYKTARAVLDTELFQRLLRFGGPNGIQLFLNMAAFNLFIVAMGRISVEVLTASGIALALNNLAFTPLIGLGQSVAILVGQSIGARDIPHAKRSVTSAFWLMAYYMAVMGVMFSMCPEPLLRLFGGGISPETLAITRTMLKFVTAYLLFDGTFIIYTSAIKSAGDTRFAMWVGSVMVWTLYALPGVGACLFFQSEKMRLRLGEAAAADWALWSMWTICVLYTMTASLVFYFRYRGGRWQSMRVIESGSETVPAAD